MYKTIILTEGDYGIDIPYTYKTDAGVAINTTSYTLAAQLVFPDETRKALTVTAVVPASGTAKVTLAATETVQPGLCKLYFSMTDADDLKTMNEIATYYVREKYGGVE